MSRSDRPTFTGGGQYGKMDMVLPDNEGARLMPEIPVRLRPSTKVLRLSALLLAVALVFTGAPVWAASAEAEAPVAEPFAVGARAAVLLDMHTGKVLYAKNPTTTIMPASLAKIMTMALALEALEAGQVSLTDEVVISEGAWRLSGSSMFLNIGDRVPLESLLYGIGVLSGNDAALAVAEHLAGSEEAFVARMNKRAQELGLTGTRFADSHGLPSGNQQTTAMDMARLARIFVTDHGHGLTYMATKEFEYGGIRQTNRNRLLFRDNRVTGLKTGFLNEAGYHLVATAVEGDMSLGAVVLGAAGFDEREEDALALLNYGFREFVTLRPAWGEEGLRTLTVYKGKEKAVSVRPVERPAVTVTRSEAGQVTVTDDLPAYVIAPITPGQRLGSLIVGVGDRQETEVPLVAAAAVERGGMFTVLWDSLRLFIGNIFK